MATLEQHPGYHQGFYDAQDGEPIWEGECAPEYAAGWHAYWSMRDDLRWIDEGDPARDPCNWPENIR